MNTSQPKPEKLQQRMKRSAKYVFVWTLSWLISTAAVAFGPKYIWNFDTTFTLFAIFIYLFFGCKMIIANKNHLMDMDEMQRKIHFNAMAISLGVSLVFGAIYGLLDDIKLIEGNPNSSHILFVMGISYVVAVFVESRKYL